VSALLGVSVALYEERQFLKLGPDIQLTVWAALSDVLLKEMDFCCIRVKVLPEVSGLCDALQRTKNSLDKSIGSVPQHYGRDSAPGAHVFQGEREPS
jgi:hypothetical protein